MDFAGKYGRRLALGAFYFLPGGALLMCPLCDHKERPVIEALLSFGEPLPYIMQHYPELNKRTLRNHAEEHMEAGYATRFASSPTLLREFQEWKRRAEGIIEVALDGAEPRPLLALNAIGTLQNLASRQHDMMKEFEEQQQSLNQEAQAYKAIIVSMVNRHPELLEEFQSELAQKQITGATE
jgi:hypothetical protein